MAESEDHARQLVAIGIDLGTANSRVGIWLDEENRFQLISDDHGHQSTPSYVAFTETERLIGSTAKDQVSKNPANTVFDAKRLIGRRFSDLGTDADKLHIQWPFRVARGEDEKPMIHVEYKGREKMFSAVEVYSMILGKMRDLAEVYSSSVVTEACVSVPHCFTSAQRVATRNACSLAGFESVTLVNEPVCAALAYTLNTIGPSLGAKKVMVFDLGGGSLDVTLFTIEKGVIEVNATSGESQLGGEDFDLRLVHHFVQEIKLKYERDITSHPRVMRRLKQQVERVKLALSSELETTIQIDSLLEDFNFYSTISRASFEAMNMDLFETCIKHVEECLRRADVDKVDVHEVVLIGGCSRIPRVQELLAEFFDGNSKLNTSINPDEAVVCGAAARAGISRGCTAFTDYLVVDVIPISLGLETVGGVMHVMHPRNSTIPKSTEQLFTTVEDDQSVIFIQVFEGENSQTCDNMLVATIELSGIPPASRGVPQILVRFDIDAYGILTVSAKDKTSGAKVEICMDQEVDIDRAHHDDEDRQRLSIQVFNPSENPNHPSSWLGPHESSNASKSSPHEPFSIAIESTSPEVSEPSEAYKSADSTSQELNSKPSPAFALSNTVDNGDSQEICEPSPVFELSDIVESRSQPEVSEPISDAEFEESSNNVDNGSQVFFEAPQAFESSNSLESMDALDYLEPPVLAFEEFPEPLHESNVSIVETNKSEEFSGPDQASDQSSNTGNCSSSRDVSNLVQEILDTVHVITPISDLRTHKRECITFIRRVNMLVPLFEEFRDLELTLSEEVLTCFSFMETALNTVKDLILLCSKGSKLWLILEERKVAEQFLLLNTALVQALDKLPESLGISDEVREQVDLVHSQLKRSKALEDAVDAQLNAELVSILDESNERSPDQLMRLAQLFKLDTASALRKEFEALDGMTKEPAPGFVNMQGVDQIFGLLSDLRTAFPLEVLEQREHSKPSGNVVEGSSREFSAPPSPPAPSNSSNSPLEGRSQDIPPQVNKGVESSSPEISVQPPQVNRGAESRSEEFGAHPPPSADSIDGRSLEFSELPQVTRDETTKSQEFSTQPPQVNRGAEGRSQEFAAQPPSSADSIDGRSLEFSELPQVTRDETTKSQEFSTQPPQVNRGAEGRSQEFAAQPPSSAYSTDARSLEYSEPQQVTRDETTKSQEFSALPFQVNGGAENRSQEFAAQPPQSPYSSSSSIDGRSLEFYSEPPPQFTRDEKINPEEFSAPSPPQPLPSNSSNSLDGSSQEFSAHPPRSPYSSSNNIDGRSLEFYSEPPQVTRDEKMKPEEFSAPPEAAPLPSNSSNSLDGSSFEFSAQPPRSAYSSSNSIDGRSLEFYSEPPQVTRDEKINPGGFSAPPPPPLPSNSSNSLEGSSQEFSAHPPRSPCSSSNNIDGRSLEFYSEPPQVTRDEKMKPEEFSVPPEAAPLPSNSSNSLDGSSFEFSAQPPRSAYSSSNSIDGRSLEFYSEPPQVTRDEKIKPGEFSAPPPPPPLPSNSSNSLEGSSQEFSAHSPLVVGGAGSRSQEFAAQPPQSPYSSSNSIDGRSVELYSEVKRDEKVNPQEFSAPIPTYKSSHSFQGIPNSTFGSTSSELSEPLRPSHYSPSSTPERSQEFPEYSSKPEFPEHSRGPEYKAWNGLEGKPIEPSESPLSADRMTSLSESSRRHDTPSPSYRSSSTSEASSEEFSGSGPHGGIQHPVSEPPPELRRSTTSADEPTVPRPDLSNRSASCPQIIPSDSIIEEVVKKYTWDQVLVMTNDLTKTIGKGGFGAVYLGKLENEKEVAVKILDASSQQGITEFLNEVNLLKRVNHVNLVRLLGYCLDEKQVLIYEFAEEGSIWDHLQGVGRSLDWRTRLNIALQSACGLEYLHTGCHPRIIHRDIKSQNILLTKSMVAKVADFGLSKLGADQDNVSKTHVTTMVKGTLGYLDPEYLKTGQLTEKSDVYSFGVVLLEIITGRKPIQATDKKGFIGDWVEEHYNSSNTSSRAVRSVADPALGGHFNPKAMKLVLNVVKDCMHACGTERPEMTQVVHVLRKAQMIEHDEKKSSKWLPFL